MLSIKTISRSSLASPAIATDISFLGIFASLTAPRLASYPCNTWWLIPAGSEVTHLPDDREHQEAIGILGQGRHNCIPCCHLAEEDFGVLAADHLFERGYRQVGTVSLKLRPRISRRFHGFRKRCEALSLHHHQLSCGGMNAAGLDTHLAQLLDQAPKPLALFCPIDNQAAWLRDQILLAGFHIPNDIAIIGTGDLLRPCLSRMPFLSSVAMPWRLLGNEAGYMFHFRTQSGTWPERRTLAPRRVISRSSTQAITPTDTLVVDAIAWMTKHLDVKQLLPDLSQYLGVSANTVSRGSKRILTPR